MNFTVREPPNWEAALANSTSETPTGSHADRAGDAQNGCKVVIYKGHCSTVKPEVMRNSNQTETLKETFNPELGPEKKG